uniref:NADH-ubiquinone oxidoreductase chain 4L n=1 Tax=Stenus clavicornis TaxID=1202167 RepID=A0A191ZS01_9COLE|nr:NADH dehydrogenase subunit 4L [Stenus clavicornis]
MMIYLILIMYFLGLFSYSMKRKHFLLMLIMLEFLVMISYFLYFIFCMSFYNEFYFLVMFFIMMVCESSLGLSVLVSIIRINGNDYFKSMSIMW